MLGSITWDQFVNWREFYNTRPWGWEADSFRSATVAAAVYNVYRKRHAAMVRASDVIAVKRVGSIGGGKEMDEKGWKRFKGAMLLAWGGLPKRT